jgi:hypothetical protein
LAYNVDILTGKDSGGFIREFDDDIREKEVCQIKEILEILRSHGRRLNPQRVAVTEY